MGPKRIEGTDGEQEMAFLLLQAGFCMTTYSHAHTHIHTILPPLSLDTGKPVTRGTNSGHSKFPLAFCENVVTKEFPLRP